MNTADMRIGQINREDVISRISALGHECIDLLIQEFALNLPYAADNIHDLETIHVRATKLVDEALRHRAEQGHPPLILQLIRRMSQLSFPCVVPQRPNGSIGVKESAVRKRVFISHSSKNIDTAEKLIDLLETGLIIEPNEIRCTSVTGYRLGGGYRTSNTLREEIRAAELIIGIITPDSVESHYVLFELGASWVLEKTTIPLLAQGANPLTMRAPLNELHAIQLSDLNQVNQILDDIVGQTTIKPRVGSAAAIGAKAQALHAAAVGTPA